MASCVAVCTPVVVCCSGPQVQKFRRKSVVVAAASSSTSTHHQYTSSSPSIAMPHTIHRNRHHDGTTAVDAVVSVCTGKHCSKRGSGGVLKALQEETMYLNDCVVDVRCSGCLGHCKKGPAVHIMDVKTGNDVTCVRVDGHDFQSLAAAMYYDE